MPEPSETKMHRLPIHVGDELSGTTMTLFQMRGRTIFRIAQCDSVGHYATKEECEANAARLELCWNSHDALVEALSEEVAFFDKLQSDNPGDPLNEMRERVHGKRIAKARSALKLAQGGPTP